MDTNPRVIHLVYPDSEVLLSLYEVLTAAGYQVSGSTTCGQALEYIARVRPDLVLSHREMPDMDGLAFLEQVRQVSPQSLRVQTSPEADRSMLREVLAWGAVDLLPEPLRPAIVLRTLDRILDPAPSAGAPDRPGGVTPAGGIAAGREGVGDAG